MAEAREPSHPPSEPQPSLLRVSSPPSRGKVAEATSTDRPVRIQLFVALLLGLVLVATGLYLWRRPTSTTEPAAATPSPSGSAVGDGGAPVTSMAADAGSTSSPSGVTLSEAKVLACQDRGPKKTAPADCDRLSSVEQALAKAIEESSSCVPENAGGGTIEYVADVSFLKKKVNVVLPKDGRSLKNQKALLACAGAVKRAMSGLSVDGMTHAHARYKISITATYPGPLKPR
jgi:hypothetical protein